MSADLPILWPDKENSPELKAFLEQYGSKYYFTAEEINQLKRAVNEMALIQQSTFLGAAEPALVPAGTGRAYWIAVKPGTYANHGGVVVAANEIAFIIRDVAGAFSISKTPLDLSTKVNVSDVVNTLVSTETTKPLSAAQGKALNEKIAKGIPNWVAGVYTTGDEVNHLGKDWVSNAAIISTDVPGVSSKWVERLSGYVENSDINKGTFNSFDNENPSSQQSVSNYIKPIYENINFIEQADGFYLTDVNGYVIAKVTNNGIQSVGFLNKNGEDLAGVSNDIKLLLQPDGFHFVDYLGYVIGKITAAGFQGIDFLDKDGNSLRATVLNTLIKGKQFYSLGDSLSAANLWQPKLAELTNSTFNAALNLSAPLSVGGTRTGGVNTTCGQWRAKLLFDLNVNPEVILIENINDLNIISSLGTINDEPFMLSNIITYPSTFASLAVLNTWLADGSFATYLASFATIDKKIGSGIRFPYTDGTTLYREYIFDSKVVANWTTTSFWKYESSGATIYKVYKGLLEYLKSKFPAALIMWFAPTRVAIQTVSGQTGYNATFWNADGSFNMTAYKASTDVVNYQTLVDAQKAVCKYYAIPFLNVNDECGINPLNFLTYYPQYNVHPLPSGYEKWGETIAKLI